VNGTAGRAPDQQARPAAAYFAVGMTPRSSSRPAARVAALLSMLVACGTVSPQADPDAAADAPPPPPRELRFTGPGDATMQYGTTGTPAFLDRCPEREALRGLTGSTATVGGGYVVVSQLAGQCGYAPIVDGDDGDLAVRASDGTSLPLRGTRSEGAWGSRCPEDQFVVGFAGHAGVALDQLAIRCAPLAIARAGGGGWKVTTGPITQQDPAGAPGGAEFPVTDCPAGEVAVSVAGHADGEINAFGLVCVAPTPE